MRRNTVTHSAIMSSLLGAALVAVISQAFASNLIFCSEDSPAGFNPAQYTTGTDFDAAAETIFNRLIQLEHNSTKVLPGLAESWDVGDDGKTYTFRLRKGAKFRSIDHFKSTREFNADDMLFIFERIFDKDHPLHKAYPTELPYFADMDLDKNIARIEKFDKHAVKFILDEVDATFIQNLAMSFSSIQFAEYAAQLLKQGKASDINQKLIGTGPFVFSRYQRDAQIRFRGNKDYWKPDEVKVDSLIFAIDTDASVCAQKLKAGKCQITLNPRPVDLDALKRDPNLDLSSQTGFNLGYIAYSVTHKPFGKLEVRQALDMTVNKKAIIGAIYQGAGQLASNGIPPIQWSYDETIEDVPYDPAKARELLKRTGVVEGTEITLWAMPVQCPYNPNAKLMAEMLQNDWAKIGIEAKIVTYEWDKYIKCAKGDEHDAMLIGWSGDDGGPDNWLGTLYGCDAVDDNNFSKWYDAGYDKLVRDAKRTTDQGKRTKLYKQAQHILKEQVSITPIAHSTVYQPMRGTVHDFRISPFGLNSFYEVSVGKQLRLPAAPPRHERDSASPQDGRPGLPAPEELSVRPRSALRCSLLLLAFAADAAIQVQPKTLAVYTEAAPEGFSPARYTSGYTFDASAHPLYNALAVFAPGSATVIPALMESWDVSTDSLVYTFRLRQGVKFHNTGYFKPTCEFDADDMLFSFQRVLDPRHPAHGPSPSDYPYANAMQLHDIVERIEKIDEHQVRFVLKHSETSFLVNLAMPFDSILSTECVGQLIARGKGDELNSKPIGTGPFVFIRYRKDVQMRYTANPDYWRGKPAIDRLVPAITLDPSVRVQHLHRNECQVVLTPEPEDIAALRQDPQLTMLEEAAMITSHAAVNTRHEPFDDPRVHRAITIGFNKSSYLEVVFGDQAHPAVGPHPPMLLGYDDSIRDWPYGPERAKALLKEVGVAPDTLLNLYISTGSGPDGNPARVAQLIQSDLTTIGIRVNIRQFEWGEVVKRTKAGERDMMLYSWIGDNDDPDSFLAHSFGCASVESRENRTRQCDKDFDEAIRKAHIGNDENQRVVLYKGAQRVFHEQMPWLPLAHPLMFNMQRKNVSGYRMSPVSARNFSWMKLD